MSNSFAGTLQPGRLSQIIITGVLLLLFYSLNPRGTAADGNLDPSFGFGGLMTTDFFADIDEAHALALQSDGRIVVAGITREGEGRFNFALARYHADGSVDLSFGNAGRVVTDFRNTDDIALAMAVQGDGRILVVGYSDSEVGVSDMALARYLPDGALDGSFGSGGKVLTDFANNFDGAHSVAVQLDGKILVAGRAVNAASDTDFALVRYHPDGSLDGAFGTAGKVTTDFAGRFDQATALALQPDGRIVVVGYAVAGATGREHINFGVVRYTPAGLLDGGFGIGGKVVTDFAGQESGALSVAMQKDGRIVVAGSAFTTNAFLDFALVRYNSNGSLDRTFSEDGKVTTDFAGNFDEANGVVIQADGRIVLGGFAGPDFGMSRHNADGSLDSTFGSAGTVVTDFQGRFDLGLGIALQRDGKIVAVGRADIADTGTDFGLARFLVQPPTQALRWFLHSTDVAASPAGFVMNEKPANGKRILVNLSTSPSWISERLMTGSFPPGTRFNVGIPYVWGSSVTITVRLSATNLDGSNERLLGQATQSGGSDAQGNQDEQRISIPVATPVGMTRHRMKLTISSSARVSLPVSSATYLDVTTFSGIPE